MFGLEHGSRPLEAFVGEISVSIATSLPVALKARAVPLRGPARTKFQRATSVRVGQVEATIEPFLRCDVALR